jgi:mono/diheme cytochrome c family protein
MLSLAACERGRHDMYDQPRYKPYGESGLFSNHMASRVPPQGSVAHAQGPLAGPSSGRLGENTTVEIARARAAVTNPYPVTAALLAAGRERYEIYCVPCHSPLGDGDGRVVQRGFPAPPSYHIDRLRAAPDRHFFDVMTNGYGIMLPYADRLTPPERWSVVAYIRALQLSQHVAADKLPASVQARLAAVAPSTASSGAKP